MLVRSCILVATSALALSATACSSLTRPDEILIYAEPPPAAPTPQPAAAAHPGGAAQPMPARPGGGG